MICHSLEKKIHPLICLIDEIHNTCCKHSDTNRCAAIEARKGHKDSNVTGNQIANYKL